MSGAKAAGRYGKKAAAKAAATAATQKAAQPGAQAGNPAAGQDQDQAAQMMQRYGGGG